MKLVGLGLVVFLLLFLTSQQVFAHTQGGPPYVAVDGEYADTAPVVASRLRGPQDLVKREFLLGSNIHFVLDMSRLSLPATIVDLSKWRWNFEGTNYQEGTSVSHTFSKPGSYIVALQLGNPGYGKGFLDYDLIQVNIVPQSLYQLPNAKVSVSAQKDANGNLVANFSASVNSDSRTKVKEVLWDFGDGQQDRGSNVAHTYQPFAQVQLITVRTTDDSGLFNDSSWKLDSQGNLTKNVANYSGVVATGNSNWLILLVAVGTAIIFIGTGLAIWKLRS